jgi:hypothetical protein
MEYDSPPKRLRRLPLQGATLVDRQSRIHGVRLALPEACVVGGASRHGELT